MDAFLGRLRTLPRRRIVSDDYARAFHEAHPDTAEKPNRRVLLAQALTALAQEGYVRLPSKAAANWDPIGVPPLPRFVTLVADVRPAEAPVVDWLPVLQEAGRTSNPRRLADLKRINDYLIGHPEPFEHLVPYREQALALFGDEKRWDRQVKNGMLYGSIPLEAVGAMEPAGPLAFSRFPEVLEAPLLVLENQHTYASCVQWNRQAKQFSAIACGDGFAVTRAAETLRDLAEECHASTICYFGDLDPSGLLIASTLNTALCALGAPRLQPWDFGYRWLLQHGTRRSLAEGNKRQVADTSWLGAHSSVAENLFLAGQWCPQEALGLSALIRDFEHPVK